MFKTAKEVLVDSKLLDPLNRMQDPYLEEDEDKAIYHVGEFEYHAEHINQNNFGIRAVITLKQKGEIKHRNLISLYSARARTEFINRLKGLEAKLIERHLLSLESELRKFVDDRSKDKLAKTNRKHP